MASQMWVIAEQRDGKIKKVTLELLSEGRKIAGQLNLEVAAVLMGQDVAGLADDLKRHGAERIYLLQSESLASYTTDGYTNALADLIKEQQPEVVLMGCTVTGRDLMAQVAQRLQAGLLTDCTGMEVQDGKLVFTRPIYAGKAFVKVECESKPAMATVRPNTFPVVENPGAGEIVEVAPNVGDIRQIIKDVVRQVSQRPELTEADIIVSGGRGMKGPENFKLLEELADVLGAAVGASRAAVDAGWVPHSMQVGQTGKTVSPTLYIACGISGAIQHLAGMSSSKCIVAINKDPEANIFKVADYGIVGDLFEVVPILTEEFKKLLAN